MAKKKYYAVRQGRKTGIYQTWGECKKQVQGYKNSIVKPHMTKVTCFPYVPCGTESL